MNIEILTIGTRGDVQPYIALGKGLQAAGHAVTIATQAEFEPLVRRHGLQHNSLRGDFLQAAGAGVNSGANLPGGNPLGTIRTYIRMAADTLEDEWRSAQQAEVLIYNPAAFGGYHLAEKLEIPAFAAFPAPLYSPTRAFPSPFFPFRSLGPFNRLSHRLFARLGPALFRGPIRRWRREVLGLPPAKSETSLRGRPVPTLYAYSQAVVPRPDDWDASTMVTGYWFLEAPGDWQPAPELVAFLQNGPPPVYVGFGSMFMQGGPRLTEIVIRALTLAGQRGLLATGWGGLESSDIPEGFFVLDQAPHDWLFPQVAAVIHHGGAGTTGAGLRSGKPGVVCPFWGTSSSGAGESLRLEPDLSRSRGSN